MKHYTRRHFTRAAASGLAIPLAAQIPGERPPNPPAVEVLNPRNRVPVSFMIDDSTCLVNLAHFGIPQFAEVFPERYKQDWRCTLPRWTAASPASFSTTRPARTGRGRRC